MKELKADLWEVPANVRIITTNGTIKRNGEAVMGRGCAAEAAKRYPDFPSKLGEHLRKNGNVHGVFYVITTMQGSPSEKTRVFRQAETRPLGVLVEEIWTFPVKHAWFERADFDLIERSWDDIKVKIEPDLTYVMPRPGCGNGRLGWVSVKAIFEDAPDNIIVVDYPDNAEKA